MKHFLLFVSLLLLIGSPTLLSAQETEEVAEEEEVFYNKEDNAVCLRCHGNAFFEEENEEMGETIMRKMFRGLRIDTTAYYQGTHRQFFCTDCHSWDYNTYPHDRNLRLEYMATCLDCHGGDDTYAQYNFEGIQTEYEKSVHAEQPEGTFSCWSCHNPHNFRMQVRSEENIVKVVQHDNSMCLSCHGAPDAPDFYMGTGLEMIINQHDWLPSTENHFRKVRCIECHTDIEDEVLVPHNVVEKEMAVKRCDECHTRDSRLIHSLYKYRMQQDRVEKGFVNGVISSEGYVIGANRSTLVNWIGILLILGTFLGIGIHVIIRIIKK